MRWVNLSVELSEIQAQIMETEHTPEVRGESHVYKVDGKNAQKSTAHTMEKYSCNNCGSHGRTWVETLPVLLEENM